LSGLCVFFFFLVFNNNTKKNIRLLVAKGANVNVPDVQDITPLSAALSNGHDEIVKFLSSVGGSIDTRRNGASEEELAFLRAANKLYIGARKQDLTALDQEDLLSLQAHLLQEIKHHAVPVLDNLYHIEETPPVLLGDVQTPLGIADKALQQRKVSVLSDCELPEVPAPEVAAAWRSGALWPASGMAWILRRPDAGDWEKQLRQVTVAALALPFVKVWKTGLLMQKNDNEMVAVWWQRATEQGEWNLFVVARAKDGKSLGIGMASMMIQDVLLRVWGNQLFEG
jgi:hypothetical protein